ncbi:MAG: hypothetical protein IH830_13450 [Planctomycetes bacterium]|nr:hypothetical protein [Planctomycetota bacterium]
MKNESGVDIVGDILDSRTQDGIRSLRARSILCTNILEHVANREGFCRVCEDLLPAAGLLLVSVPYRYPYHPDPIDTLFRPDLGQLKRLWRDLDFVEGKIVSFGNYFRAMRRKKWLIARDAYLVFAGVAKIDRWRVLVGNYRFLFSRYEASCAVFRKR